MFKDDLQLNKSNVWGFFLISYLQVLFDCWSKHFSMHWDQTVHVFLSLPPILRTKGITAVRSFGASVISTSPSKISVRPSLSYSTKSLITIHNVSIRALTINLQVYNLHLISFLYLSQCFLVIFLPDVVWLLARI